MPTYRKSVFIFRRDLRLHDNTGLNDALTRSDAVLPCFVFDPRQTQDHAYFSAVGFRFMSESLRALDADLAAQGAGLTLLSGVPAQVLPDVMRRHAIDAVFVNRDYTPFSARRDAELRATCEAHGVAFHASGDLLIHEPHAVAKADGGPYTVFTPFYRRAVSLPVRRPQAPAGARWLAAASHERAQALMHAAAPLPRATGVEPGGRAAAALLGSLAEYRDYPRQRDQLAADMTTRLSAHLKFGTCSIRAAHHAIVKHLGRGHALLRQLYWRDFFTHVAWHFPRVFDGAFQRRYDAMPWENDARLFDAWCSGRTGFPVVDAGMRELNATGFMHNRARMITASFLVKDLHIDWRWGERYFARHLVDYDPCVNNGNWQWAASTGCDAQPYFRVFNPWRQQQTFDPDCRYIYRWIPELRAVAPAEIHRWYACADAGVYPAPVIDHAARSATAKAMYRACRDQPGVAADEGAR